MKSLNNNGYLKRFLKELSPFTTDMIRHAVKNFAMAKGAYDRNPSPEGFEAMQRLKGELLDLALDIAPNKFQAYTID